MSVAETLSLVDQASEGFFGIAVLLIIWLVFYIRKRNVTPTKEAIAGASWITMIVALLLRYLELINDWVLMLCIVAGIGSIIMLINRE